MNDIERMSAWTFRAIQLLLSSLRATTRDDHCECNDATPEETRDKWPRADGWPFAITSVGCITGGMDREGHEKESRRQR